MLHDLPCKNKGTLDLGSIAPASISVGIIITCDNIFVMGAAYIETPNSTWWRLAVLCSPCARIVVWITLGRFVSLTASPDAVEKVSDGIMFAAASLTFLADIEMAAFEGKIAL
jgi:hypothetical protein